MLIDPLFQLLAALCVSALFATAAVHKWRSPLHFEGVLGQYKLLPRQWIALVSLLIPIIEVAIAVLLLLARTRIGAAVAALLLLITYSLAIAINLGRGRSEIDCGCGEAATQISAVLLVRNALLMLLPVLLMMPTLNRSIGALDVVTALLGAAVLGLCYISWNQLLANHSYKKKVWK